MVFMTYRYAVGCLIAGFFAIGCQDDPPPRREPPPPKPAAATCTGERKTNDPSNLALFPEKTGTYCLDPQGSDRGFGESAKNPIDGICDLFDGECEIYKRFEVSRVVEARYVDGGGSGHTIDVKLSKFSSSENAYAMFTKRVVGDNDPAHADAPKKLEGGGASALGWGNAYLWRGKHLAEIVYSAGPEATDKQIRATGDKLLPPLVRAFGDKITGSLEPPAAAAKLPTEKRVPLGIRFETKEMLGVKGTGAGAFGYYKDGAVRWRVLSIVKTSEDDAKDVLKSFAAIDGAAPEKLGDDGTRIMVKYSGPQTEWIIARKGAAVIGIGDEPRALRSGMTPDEHREKTLTQDKKRELLGAIISSAK